MRSVATARWAVLTAALAFLLLCLPSVPRVFADEEPAAEEAAEDGSGAQGAQAEPIEADEAKKRAKLLSSAARKRRPTEALALMDEAGFVSHQALHKPLLKLLKHDTTAVAVRAAELLGAQQVESEKDREKLARSIWKSGWGDRANKKRYPVRTASLLAVTGLRGTELSDADVKEVQSLWRATVGDPQEANAPALIDICVYVRRVKDKRLCRQLAEEIDQPMATAPNSPTNPPAEWWERRWKLWKPVYAEAVESLEVLTGQSFKSTEEARDWLRDNEREFGFRW